MEEVIKSLMPVTNNSDILLFIAELCFCLFFGGFIYSFFISLFDRFK